jgi:glutamate-1-semialdehyde 2,1-aminomutase
MSIATQSRIISQYTRRTRKSADLFARAQQVLPSGIVHDARHLRPHPIYTERAQAARKWDVDGNQYVDYVGGHGALLLGHNHPQVTQAASRQLGQGTHFGACHEPEVRWAETVCRLVPSAERVRFTASGTEATMLAMRLARAYTGKPKIVRFIGHFHGWQDHVAFGVSNHQDGSPCAGVLTEVAENVLLLPPGDLEAVRDVLARRTDVAAVILEPTGASWGQIPLLSSFLTGLREATADHDVLLIFDEVISGFRCAPGGAQELFGITPELTTMAKILAGGFPGGAVAGRQDVMDLLDFDQARTTQREKVIHTGTFNANPVSAAAGVATLEIIEGGKPCRQASNYAQRLRDELNAVLREEQVNWSVYGTFSGFHIYTNPENEPITAEDIDAGRVDYRKLKGSGRPEVLQQFRLAMLIHGVDMFGWPGGVTSAVHTDNDLADTIGAFRSSLKMLKSEGTL